MSQQSVFYIVIFWAARVIGSIILAFLLFMVFGHLFSDGFDAFNFRNYYEVFLFLCFPILTTIGLIKAYRRPLRGGLYILLSMIAFYALQKGDLHYNIYLVAPLLPGLLYVILGLLPKPVSN